MAPWSFSKHREWAQVAVLAALLALCAPQLLEAAPRLLEALRGGAKPKARASPGLERYHMKMYGVKTLDAMCINSSLDHSHFLSPEPPRPIRPIVYLKTHKTGSTTLSGVIYRLADRRNLRVMLSEAEKKVGGRTFDYPNPFPGADQEAPAREPLQRYHAIAQHAVYNGPRMRSYVRPNPFFLSVIREPGSQFLSGFNFVRSAWSEKGWDELLEFLGSAAEPEPGSIEAALFLNPQSHDFGWYEHVGHTRDFDRNETRVREWLATLKGDFVDNGLVILLEHWSEGMVLLRRRLNLSMDDVVSARLRTATYAYRNKTQESLAQARTVLPVDLELYAHFQRTFWDQWAAEDGPALQAELAEFRALDAEIKAACASQDHARCPVRVACGNGITCAYYVAITRLKSTMNCAERNGDTLPSLPSAGPDVSSA